MLSPSVWELTARLFEKPTPKWATPADMADELDPKHRRTPVINYINDKLVEAWDTHDARLTVSVPPQSGKSELAVRRYALWALTQNPDCRIVIASYESNVARRWGRVIRDDIREHGETIGNLRIRDDVSSQSEWLIEGHKGGVYTVGVGGALTGRAADLVIIDDPVKGLEQADSKTYQERLWDWWQATVQTRLSPGSTVVVIQTRWHQLDLAGRLETEYPGEWDSVNIPAKADHRPERGETDPLGREPGEYLKIPSGRSTTQWEQRERNTAPRTWAALYQGRPSPDEGGIFPADWKTYDQPHHHQRPDGACIVGGMERDDQEMAISADLAFRDTKTSDYVVLQVWLRIGVTIYLLDQVRDRLNFTDTQNALRALCAKWPQAYAKFIEAKANGDAVINSLQREIPGLIPVEPEGSKEARASAISPFAFSGNIVLPTARLLPNAEVLREEAKNFPNASHDDTIDAMSQAANQLLLRPLDDGYGDIYEPVTEDDYTISAW